MMEAQTRLEAAADWWARLQDEETTHREVSEWLDWLEAHPQNREAFERIQELSLRLAASGRRRKTSPLPLALAASVVVAVIGALAWAKWGGFLAPSTAFSLTTPVAASKQAPLPDGSKIMLGGATAVEADYTSSSRDVRLKDGEAYFTVAKEATRPFVVIAGAVSIRALGTSFNVRKTRDRVSVTVTEGRVEIVRSGLSGAGIEVAAGEQALYDPGTNRFRVATVDTSRTLAWRSRRLEFVDEPMDSVIANVNRYSSRKIEVRGVNLHDHSYTGTFHPDTMEDWLIAIERAFPVKVERRDDAVLIEARG